MIELANGNQFIEKANCTTPVPEDYMNLDSWVQCYDNDGFELSKLEKAYYAANGFPIRDRLNHECCQRDWFFMPPQDGFILDHALVLEKKGFAEAAREQIEHHSKRNPQLVKYLKSVPKWGIDFAMEYYEADDYMEVLHIEYDYTDLDKAKEARKMFEHKLMATDWKDFVKRLKKKKNKWEGLRGMMQNDWKAKYWGLAKAEKTIKSFT